MDRQEILEKVKLIIIEQLQIGDELVTGESTFKELGVDSLDAVEIAMRLEETFEIDIPDEDAEKITSVRGAVDYIERVLGERAV